MERPEHARAVAKLLSSRPVVAVLGARQVGKTTLARRLAASTTRPVTFFDLEDPRDRARLAEPTLALEGLRGLVVLDEVQLLPELFPVLRVLADRPRRPARFLVLGSASPDLLRQGAETLAGRIAFYELDGFDLEEVGARNLDRLWLRGGFPSAYLARTEGESFKWRADFVSTFVERDVPRLGIGIDPAVLGRFWTMLAHYHGQVCNLSELGRSLGVSHTTVRSYVDLLVKTFVIRELRPWAENLGKRLVKAPKVYVADSGLVHSLLNIPTRRDLDAHPKLGASWEGFMIAQLTRRLRAARGEVYFWATHAGAELDLMIVRGRERLGFEIKRTDAPKVTPSMRSALEDLKLSRLYVVHAGRTSFDLDKRIRCVAAAELLTEL
ncbi:MAG TPA: ATP-binding protein [Polyangiaceae bacterium]|nr:ATP-binding protein [Polyangiaceae bacterium]